MQHENSQLLGRFTQLEQFELKASLATNLITKYISIKIKITHLSSLNKSPHRLKKELRFYHPTKPYLTNQNKYTKKLYKNLAIGKL